MKYIYWYKIIGMLKYHREWLGYMFTRNKANSIKRCLELEDENEMLKEKLMKYKESQILSLYSAIIQLSNANFNNFIGAIEKNKISRIKIFSVMENIEFHECFMSIWYGVKVYGYDTSNNEVELLIIPVEQIGDGCFISEFAVRRRLNLFNLTLSISNFIKSEIERQTLRYGESINIEMSEIRIEGLLKI